MSVRLGCIADDYTGATDLGAMLTRAGMRVLLIFGLPDEPLHAQDCDALIIALKSRSIPVDEAVKQSLSALTVLQAAGAEQLFFKYCSTFDSTDKGNIGPVAEALADQLNAPRVLFCPAFPENGRTVYQGHLFVHGNLLNDSGMENHPLNPMSDANLLRVLSRQSTRQVALLPYDVIDRGLEEAAASLKRATDSDAQFIVTDALTDRHLQTIAAVGSDDVLITGGSAIGQALAEVIQKKVDRPDDSHSQLELPGGPAVVIAGSCSLATQRQVAVMQDSAPSLQVDPLQLAAGEQTVEQIINWAASHTQEGPLLFYSTADAQAVAISHSSLGQQAACNLLEEAFGQIAVGLVQRGVRRLVVAGGETSGAVMRELGCNSVWIGKEIAPGVPWVLTRDEPQLAFALKSGNFGADTFFLDALRGQQ